MVDVMARSILSELGTNSIREVVRKTGSPIESVAKQLQIGAIGDFYVKNRGAAGPLGLSLSDTRFDAAGSGQRSFSGGKIQFLHNKPNRVEITEVRARFVGFHTNAESNELSESDEPYFIVGVAATNGSKTVKFGPFENVDAGEDRSVAALICDLGDHLAPPIVLGVVGMEHDEGSPEEAEKKVREIFLEIERKVEDAAKALGAFSGDNHVIPEFLRDILIGWVPEGIAAVLGLGDDHINTVNRVLFDFDPALTKWTTPPKLGDHLGNPFNVALRVNQEGQDEGDHTLFFNVEVFDTITEPR